MSWTELLDRLEAGEDVELVADGPPPLGLHARAAAVLATLRARERTLTSARDDVAAELARLRRVADAPQYLDTRA